MRHFLDLTDLTGEEARSLLRLAHELKADWRLGGNEPILRNQVLGLIFEKQSLRTRVSFEVAMLQLGGSALMLGPQEIGIGSRETTADMARVMSRYVNGVMLRTYAHSIIQEFAEYSAVPVINGLTDSSHPCQAMADMLTIAEHFGQLAGIHLVYLGDGNNVARSLLRASALYGLRFTLVSPPEYALPAEDFQTVAGLAAASGAKLAASNDPQEAVRDAQAIYTDVWVSMGMKVDTEKRKADFTPYQVNAALMALAPKDAIVLHDLPAHRGEEITDEVADGRHSRIFDQAENRLHAQKAILATLMNPETAR